jgi:hypothetical protein
MVREVGRAVIYTLQVCSDPETYKRGQVAKQNMEGRPSFVSGAWLWEFNV